MIPALFSALCGLAVLGLLYAEFRENARLRWVFKPLASLCFILAAIAAGALSTPFGTTVLAALVLCAAGDVLLIPRSNKTFLAGMATFASGHVGYIAAFVIAGVALTPVSAAAGAAMALFAILMVLWLRPGLGEFKIPVIGYSVIISTMVVASVAHWAAAPSDGALLLVVAAVAFAISDVAVARDQFKQRAFVNRLWGLPLYYATQCLFALSV